LSQWEARSIDSMQIKLIDPMRKYSIASIENNSIESMVEK
jgi:hypothetical protein